MIQIKINNQLITLFYQLKKYKFKNNKGQTIQIYIYNQLTIKITLIFIYYINYLLF